MKLTDAELKRVAELKQIGFEVVHAGIPRKLPRMTEVCYWRYMRGNRVSALHPFEEAAWRDAIREWDTVSRETAGKGVHQVPPHSPAEREEAAPVSYKLLGSILGISNVTPSMLNILQDFRSQGMTWAQLTEATARAAGWANFEDSEDASLLVVAHDDREVHFTGPTAWEQACQWEKDNNLTNPPVKEDVFTVTIKDMKTVLEAAGYTFTGVGSWFPPTMERKQLGSETAAIRGAWFHCINKGNNDA